MTDEIWTCNQCNWTGTRYNCDSHVRRYRHSVSPKAETMIHQPCGKSINARSLWCTYCKAPTITLK